MCIVTRAPGSRFCPRIECPGLTGMTDFLRVEDVACINAKLVGSCQISLVLPIMRGS